MIAVPAAARLGSGYSPMWFGTNEPMSERAFQTRGLVALTLLALMGLHVSTALYHHLFRLDTVLRRLLPRSQTRVAAIARVPR